MRQRLRLGAAALGAALCLVGRAGLAETTVHDLAAKSLEECEHGRQQRTRPDRASAFARGDDLARRALAMDDRSADAHFALFCNHGEAMRLDGETIGDVLGLRALMHELDRTLELQPDHPGALAAKGTFLVRLPRLLGGDVDRGEAMLQRVLQLDPTAVAARIALARVCEYRGRREEGIAYASRALQFARELGRADKIAEAQAMLDELHASR